MEIWLDTADCELVADAKQMGVLHGVTTHEEVLGKILALQQGPVAVEITAKNSSKMIEQGMALSRLSDRVIVKVPVTVEGLKAIHAFSQQKVPVMASAVFAPNQALLAARAGATYIAPHFSKMCELDMSGIDEFHAMLKLLRHYRYGSKLIAALLNSTEQVRQCLELGADAVSLNKEVFLDFAGDHEETVRHIKQFTKN